MSRARIAKLIAESYLKTAIVFATSYLGGQRWLLKIRNRELLPREADEARETIHQVLRVEVPGLSHQARPAAEAPVLGGS